MSTTGTSFRRGTSTILGTLIFVGIMFTAVIPMLLVMRQADTLHEMRKHELGILDQERAMENLCLYVCPQGIDSQYVEVTIVNKGDVLAHVFRLWINDEPEIVNVDIPSLSEKVLDPFNLDPVDGDEYDIRAMTERGNMFLSENGILRYEAVGWDLEEFSIKIHAAGFFIHVQVRIEDEYGEEIFDEWDMIGAGYQVIVPQPGKYWVKVTRWGDPPHTEIVDILWPLGDPWVDVYP